MKEYIYITTFKDKTDKTNRIYKSNIVYNKKRSIDKLKFKLCNETDICCENMIIDDIKIIENEYNSETDTDEDDEILTIYDKVIEESLTIKKSMNTFEEDRKYEDILEEKRIRRKEDFYNIREENREYRKKFKEEQKKEEQKKKEQENNENNEK